MEQRGRTDIAYEGSVCTVNRPTSTRLLELVRFGQFLTSEAVPSQDTPSLGNRGSPKSAYGVLGNAYQTLNKLSLRPRLDPP